MSVQCPRCHSTNPPDSPICSKCGTRLIPPDKDLDSRTVTLPNQPEEIRAGTVLNGKYRILGHIGSGGMGVVYKAEDLRLKRSVALKFLSPALTSNWEAHERFVHEAQAASALDHPNICTVHEFDETEAGQMYIAMAYYSGESLKARIERAPLGVEEALDIALQLARGLGKAHLGDIVHRDLKPGNILITEDGVAKIVDFGLARLAGTTRVTRTGTTMGTVAYMSPEQAQGQEVDHRTDLWSLGVVLFEMLTSQLPFKGEHEASLLHSIVHQPPRRLKSLKPDVPSELDRILQRALQKNPESRYASAEEMLKDLKGYQESLRIAAGGPSNLGLLLRRTRRPSFAVPALLLFLALGTLCFWFLNRQAKIRWAREELLPRIEQLVEAGWHNYVAAYKVAMEAEHYLAQDPKLAEYLRKIAVTISITTEPPGARIYMKEQIAPQSEWTYLGVTPIDKIRLPVGCFRWKMENEGYETVFAVAPTFEGGFETKWFPYNILRTLDKKGSIPPGMVRVKGQKGTGDFFIDQYEVTNRQFKEFVDRGGYQKKDYWKHRFLREKRELTWEEALKELVDPTGQPGPATWEAGEFPEGQANYPVSGVSWYEAAAYAESVGKHLPTARHWGIARGDYTPLVESHFNSFIASLSNFKGRGTAPVGGYQGMTSYGAYDMAGNVREWCWNESPKGRVIRGGAWNDATYLFQDLSQGSPFDRSPRNGFRCAIYPEADRIPKSIFQMQQSEEGPDFYRMKPVTASVFQVYKEQFSYDKLDLNARVEWRDESSKDWIQEKITFNAAYDNDRVMAYLFLPRKGLPPYQTIVYAPGGGAYEQDSSKDLDKYGEFDLNLSFIVRNRRAVLFPIYRGTFERRTRKDGLSRHQVLDGVSPDQVVPDLVGLSPRQVLEWFIKTFKDFKRSIDYLETRPEIDSTRLAFVGFSAGGWCGAIFPAIDDRLKASILYVGALDGAWLLPEINPINYVTHVRVPTLMLNGKYDAIYPYETQVRPLFDLLGTPKDKKVLKLYDTDHYIPRSELIKETLAWLDRYLGPAR